MEHRFTTYTTMSSKACPQHIKLKFQQAKRRKETLELQKEKRDQVVSGRRNVKNDADSNCMEIDGRKNKASVPHNEAYELATALMNSEWMLEVPGDLDDWIAVLCPDGKRTCVIVQDNKTKAVNKFGTLLNCFSSLFPYGCSSSSICPSHRKRTVLDCIYNYKLKKYYILDIIEWKGVPYTDCSADFRFFFIQNKLCEIPGINERSITNSYPFELAPRMASKDVYGQLLGKSYFFPENVELDGINFYHPDSLYMAGETPLVLWLKPFMVPEVLQRPVSHHLTNLNMPPDYVNIFEYSQSCKKKNKKNKKKKTNKNSLDCDEMEVDNLTEVEEANDDSVIENEMCVEN